MRKKDLKRKIRKIEDYIEVLHKTAELAQEHSLMDETKEAGMERYFGGMAVAYGLAASGLRMRLTEVEDGR